MSGIVYQSLTRKEIAYLVIVNVWGDTVTEVTGVGGVAYYETDGLLGYTVGRADAGFESLVFSDEGMGRTIAAMWSLGWVPSIDLDAGRNNVDRWHWHHYGNNVDAAFRITLRTNSRPRLARACAIASLYAIDPGAPP